MGLRVRGAGLVLQVVVGERPVERRPVDRAARGRVEAREQLLGHRTGLGRRHQHEGAVGDRGVRPEPEPGAGVDLDVVDPGRRPEPEPAVDDPLRRRERGERAVPGDGVGEVVDHQSGHQPAAAVRRAHHDVGDQVDRQPCAVADVDLPLPRGERRDRHVSRPDGRRGGPGTAQHHAVLAAVAEPAVGVRVVGAVLEEAPEHRLHESFRERGLAVVVEVEGAEDEVVVGHAPTLGARDWSARADKLAPCRRHPPRRSRPEAGRCGCRARTA